MSKFKYDDMRDYALDDCAERKLVETQTECTFIWSNREGAFVGHGAHGADVRADARHANGDWRVAHHGTRFAQ